MRMPHIIPDLQTARFSQFAQIFCVVSLATMLATMAASPSAFAATNAQSSADCDNDQFQTVLSPAPAKFDARAYWLNRHTIKWPGAPIKGKFTLYFSASGQIVADQGIKVSGANGYLPLRISTAATPARFKFIGDGVTLALQKTDAAKLIDLHQMHMLLTQEDDAGNVLDATTLQNPGALDDIYRAANQVDDLGVGVSTNHTQFKLWAPTARQVSVCLYQAAESGATGILPAIFDARTGAWTARERKNDSGGYYKYLVDVWVPNVGVVRNLVTDPYSVSLNADSRRSYIADLDSPALKPDGWNAHPRAKKLAAQTDMTVYELHVRDFSINDATVSETSRGKYRAFAETQSNGMKHLKALADAGLTDIHLLPVFDFATVPEKNCVTPDVSGEADSETQQAIIHANADKDCFNWGYDPFHFNAPEGSYATDANDGATRVREFRAMVMALHHAGLRVGMDVVYNHTTASGQKEKSVLDRIVPGYYHRLNAKGEVEKSTCCDNTATEHMMMGKLMIDSAALWAKHYAIDSFRFDLMGHQPRATMARLQARVNQVTGRKINLIGEGWNYGEVENGKRFVQASQLSLNGSGIGTFNDRLRDAARGGAYNDDIKNIEYNQGFINGLGYDANSVNQPDNRRNDLMKTADMIRVGLAGSIKNVVLHTFDDSKKKLSEIKYNDQPAGFVSAPGEVVNYVENHDNQTLYDINAYKLPLATSSEDRARVQMLGAAIVAFSEGVSYFHAGMDTLRSKSLDRNSYDSGDWFNRLDWTYADNYFGTGAPLKNDNGDLYPLIKPRLANAALKPSANDIALARDMFRDILKIRASSRLFRMTAAADIQKRLHFFNVGSAQNPTILAAHLDGKGLTGAGFAELVYFINVNPQPQSLTIPELKNKPLVLHSVHTGANAADKRPATQSRFDTATGTFSLPPRTALVYVVAQHKTGASPTR